MPVYVIQAGDGGPCKIGHTSDVSRRLANMQISTHAQLRLVAVYEGGEPEERALHKQFAAVRLRGEWFKLRLPNALNDIKLARWRPPPSVKIEKERPQGVSPDRARALLVQALMHAKGLRPEDFKGALDAMRRGVPRLPRFSTSLCEALGVDHQYLRFGRNFVRTPMLSRRATDAA